MPPEVTERVTDADDLTASDEQILDELRRGARTKGALVDETGLHRNTVGHRLDILDASGIVDVVHDTTALYELQEDPRESEGDTEADLRGRLQNALEARDDQRARAERLADDLDDCEGLLEDARESAADVDLERVQSGLETASTALEGQNPDVDMAKSEIDGLLRDLQ